MPEFYFSQLMITCNLVKCFGLRVLFELFNSIIIDRIYVWLASCQLSCALNMRLELNDMQLAVTTLF